MVKHDNITQIGRTIKELRKAEGSTLQKLADLGGISKGMLSRIENGRIIPSLPVMMNLISALNCSLTDFFEKIDQGEDSTYLLLKKGDRKEIEKENGSIGFRYFMGINATNSISSFEVNFLTIAPNSKRKKVTTDAFELKFMLRGTIEYHLDEDVLVLEEGDLFYYNGNIPHVPVNKTDQPAEMLVIYLYK